jgi:hypothetical protein
MRSDMDITRKSFLSAATYGLAGLALLRTEALSARPVGEEGAVDLRGSVGETFRARSASGALVALRLERVDALSSSTNVDQFRLVFSGDERFALREGTWRLVTADGRRAGDVFLVPAGTNAAGAPLYRADFCLLTSIAPANPAP